MKVKIAYVVNFDEVASKISEVIRKSSEKYPQMINKQKMCVNILSDDPSAIKCGAAIELIHEIRVRLSEVDQILADCSNIINGYKDAMMQPMEKPIIQPEAPEATPPNEEIYDVDER